MNNGDALELQRYLENMQGTLHAQILGELKGKTLEELKRILKDDSTEVLQHTYEIAHAAECYEICVAIKQLQKIE